MAPMRSMARYAGYAQPRAGHLSRELCGATVAEINASFTPPRAAASASSGHPRARPLHPPAARPGPAGDLLAEPSRERRGALREAQAEPVYEGRARHQREPGGPGGPGGPGVAVLLR